MTRKYDLVDTMKQKSLSRIETMNTIYLSRSLWR